MTDPTVNEPDEPCPDCKTPWPAGASACAACGLTIEQIAEDLAAARQIGLTR